MILDSTAPGQVLAALDGDAERAASSRPCSSSRRSPARRSRPTRPSAPSRRRSATSASTRSSASSSSPTRARRSTSSARADGYRVFNADPTVGGRYSALTAFGLVPSGLAGVDIAELLDEAEATLLEVAIDSPDNPALVLGRRDRRRRHRPAARDKLGLVTDGTHIVGLPDWIEQLVAESTGKDGTGILPVVLLPVSPEVDEHPGRPADRAPRRRGERVPLPRAPRRRDRSSAARSARSSWSGSTRPRSPGGCSASTRSTSPTSNRPRSPRAVCSTRAPSRPHRRSSADGIEVRVSDPALAASGTVAGVLDALWAQLPDERLRRRSRPTSTALRAAAARRACANSSPPTPAARPPSAGDRGSCTRPASTTRAAPPIGVFLQILEHDRRRPRDPRTARSRSASSSRRRPPATPSVLADARSPRRHPHPHRPAGRGARALRSRSVGVHH